MEVGLDLIENRWPDYTEHIEAHFADQIAAGIPYMEIPDVNFTLPYNPFNIENKGM